MSSGSGLSWETKESFRLVRGKPMSIDQAKGSLPLPILMASYCLGDHAKKNAFCPFHEDKRNKSFSVFRGPDPEHSDRFWYWKCHAGCGKGDEITFLEKLFGIDNATATKKFIELARDWNKRADRIVKDEIAANDWPTTREVDFDWNRIWAETKETDLIQLGNQRWFSTCFCIWLHTQKQIGFYNGAPCFPVVKDGAVVATHYKDGHWKYYPLGRGSSPFVLGDLNVAKRVHILESTWDMLSLADRTDGYLDPDTAFVATRGASNSYGSEKLRARILIWPQNDKAGCEWLKKILENYPDAVVMKVPAQFKDVNEMNIGTPYFYDQKRPDTGDS
jgi:hypothetical protein